jgi:hypothetical protein
MQHAYTRRVSSGIIVCGVIVAGCGRELTDIERNALTRPAVVNLDRVKDWSLTLNGVPFADQHHELRAGVPTHFVGRLAPQEPKNAWKIPTFYRIVLRPSGTHAGEDWMPLSTQDHGLELEAPILMGKTDRKITIDAERIPPGNYDARLYYHRWDMSSGDELTSLDLLATATVTVIH